MTDLLTHAEMKSILATILAVDAERIGGWIIAAKVTTTCSSPDCDNDCSTTALMSSGSSLEHGHDEPFMLHMAAEIVEAIAQHQNEREKT